MTHPVVIDASVVLALLLNEPQARLVRTAVARWLTEGRSIVVPDHLWLEVLNRLGRRGHTGAAIMEALQELDVMGLRTVSIDRPLLLLANDLVERHGLTAYDAAYLALGHALGATLATFDGDLIRAADNLLDPELVPLRPRPDHRISATGASYGAESASSPVSWPRWSGAGSFLGTLRRRALAELEDTARVRG